MLGLNSDVWMWLGIILAAIGVIVFFAALYINGKDGLESFIDASCVPYLISLILILLSVVILNVSRLANRIEQQKRVVECVESGYTIYLDGKLVELENINLKAYELTFNDDTKKIILSTVHEEE